MQRFCPLRSILLICLIFQGGVGWLDASTPLRYHGVIIGINEYDHWGDLRRARKDAEALATVLSDSYDFESIVTLFDHQATAAGIEATLRETASRLTSQDALLVFFSGHGYYDELLDQGFWIPSDGRMADDGQPAIRDWIENDRIKQYIAGCEAKHVLVLSDACFSGSLFKGGFADLNPTTISWYQQIADQPSRWAITSGDMEEVPDASLFGVKLLQLLKFPPREVFSVSDLAGWLRKEVAAFDGTLPVAGPLHDPRQSLNGEFVFVQQGGESRFWALPPQDPRSNDVQSVGRIQIYSNLDSQVFLEEEWAGYIRAGESVMLDGLQPGGRTLSVRSGAGVFQKKIRVDALSVTRVNAVFSDFQRGGVLNSAVTDYAQRATLYLSMDAEQDPRWIGLIENNGALIARDAIRGNALRFHQRGHVVCEGTYLDGLGKADFSISLWFKWMGNRGEEAVLLSKQNASSRLTLQMAQGHLSAEVETRGSEGDGIANRLRSKEAVPTEHWHYVVFQRQGRTLELWINGALSAVLPETEAIDIANPAPMLLGLDGRYSDRFFTGLMDEVQIDSQAKTPEEIRAGYRLKFDKFRLTRNSYSEREDLDAVVKKLYGSTAQLADWNEMLSRFDGEINLLWETLGLAEGERVWVSYLNRRFFNSGRHFYALQARDPDAIAEEIHQQSAMEPGHLVLSSWFGLELPILVEL